MKIYNVKLKGNWKKVSLNAITDKPPELQTVEYLYFRPKDRMYAWAGINVLGKKVIYFKRFGTTIEVKVI